MKKGLFKESEISTIKTPDVRNVKDYKYIFGNTVTPVCGLRKGCEFHTEDCKYYCNRKEG